MNQTKALLSTIFWELLEEKPLNKIIVKDIVERGYVNRNTFYYHFEDVLALLEYSIAEWSKEIIQTHVRFGSPIECLTPLLQGCKEHQQALLHVYNSRHQDYFLRTLDRIMLSIVTSYVDAAMAELNLPAQDMELLTRHYKCLLVGVMLDWLDHGMEYDLPAAVVRLCDLLAGSGKQAFLKSAKSN